MFTVATLNGRRRLPRADNKSNLASLPAASKVFVRLTTTGHHPLIVHQTFLSVLPGSLASPPHALSRPAYSYTRPYRNLTFSMVSFLPFHLPLDHAATASASKVPPLFQLLLPLLEAHTFHMPVANAQLFSAVYLFRRYEP